MVKGLHMVGGEGDASYAVNSLLQRKAMLKANSMVKQAIKAMVSNSNSSKIVVADLGCSSGPNTLFAIQEIVNTIMECFPSGKTLSEVQVFLNDLPENDFNNIFRSLTSFLEKLMADRDGCHLYICGVPRSFYQRILPDNSLHFINSCYSLHYISQVPTGIEWEKFPNLHKRYIHISEFTPDSVAKSYMDQYYKDFSLFLKLRAKELVVGGYMALLFVGRSNEDPKYGEHSYLWGALADALNDMSMEGLLEETELSTFKLPLYFPSLQEVATVIKEESLFDLEVANTFVTNWDPHYEELTNSLGTMVDDNTSGSNVAQYLKAVLDPMIRAHFSKVDSNVVFSRFARKIANIPQIYKKYLNIFVVLKRVKG